MKKGISKSMEIIFHTNLDEAKEVAWLNISSSHTTRQWPWKNHVPGIGTKIVLPVTGGKVNYTYELEVATVRYEIERECVRVELHIPSSSSLTIGEWGRWLKDRRTTL